MGLDGCHLSIADHAGRNICSLQKDDALTCGISLWHSLLWIVSFSHTSPVPLTGHEAHTPIRTHATVTPLTLTLLQQEHKRINNSFIDYPLIHIYFDTEAMFNSNTSVANVI